MSTPFSLPDWMPWWAQLLLLVVIILMILAFALMPFSVFGLKPRLEALEARLDEIQGEIRALSLRLPEPGRRAAYETELPVGPLAAPQQPLPRASEMPPAPARAAPPQARPPIPPAAWKPDAPRRPIGAPPAPLRTEPDPYRQNGQRLEPRIDRNR